MKTISIKYKILMIILLIYIPFIGLFQFYTNRTINRINFQLSKGYAESLQVFCNTVEEEMKKADEFLNADCWAGEEFRSAANAETTEEVTRHLKELGELVQNVLDNHVDITGAVLGIPEKDIWLSFCDTNINYTEREKEEINYMIRRKQMVESANGGWILDESIGRPMLIRTVHYNGAYATLFMDIRILAAKTQTYYNMSSPVVFISGSKQITTAFWIRHYKGDIEQLINAKGSQIVESGEKEYLVLVNSIAGLKAVYGVLYNYNWDWLRVVTYGFVAVVILSFAIIWFSLKYTFFKPLNQLLGVMKSIKEGNFSARADDFRSREFVYINETFNDMVDTVERLKIETYEMEIKAKSSQMNALRLQIRRHFFLNCLKNIYAMARIGNTDNIQKVVLLLSTHLRYTLDISHNSVELSTEMKMCQNYIDLNGVGQNWKPVLYTDIDEELSKFMIPPISILTLLENCCKYGMKQNRALEIYVRATKKMLDKEGFVSLVVQDNGSGFSKEMLYKLNGGREELVKDGHIGISNVLDRIRMIYGEECSMIFDNMDGARIEIIIPVKGETQ